MTSRPLPPPQQQVPAVVYADPMARMARKTPAELAPEPWPSGRSDDHVGEVARQFTLNLRNAIGSRSIRAAAEAAGVNHSTLLGILEGRTWPDLETIAKIELGLQADLWPGRLRD